MTIPELISQFRMLFKEFLCCDSFEYLDYVCRGEYRMSIDEEVYVIGHNFLVYQRNALLICDHFMQPMQIFGY